ncbi:uncharacterized protein LOC123383289 [Felis catus]|uniref:uncharacterized protein LOC123383289 n=1 Tax=Felis catus TaxID=9685 RepID=UPI001D19CAE7|nr:uncharacterized protein LOC123383289 [Felis catus]
MRPLMTREYRMGSGADLASCPSALLHRSESRPRSHKVLLCSSSGIDLVPGHLPPPSPWTVLELTQSGCCRSHGAPPELAPGAPRLESGTCGQSPHPWPRGKASGVAGMARVTGTTRTTRDSGATDTTRSTWHTLATTCCAHHHAHGTRAFVCCPHGASTSHLRPNFESAHPLKASLKDKALSHNASPLYSTMQFRICPEQLSTRTTGNAS